MTNKLFLILLVMTLSVGTTRIVAQSFPNNNELNISLIGPAIMLVTKKKPYHNYELFYKRKLGEWYLRVGIRAGLEEETNSFIVNEDLFSSSERRYEGFVRLGVERRLGPDRIRFIVGGDILIGSRGFDNYSSHESITFLQPGGSMGGTNIIADSLISFSSQRYEPFTIGVAPLIGVFVPVTKRIGFGVNTELRILYSSGRLRSLESTGDSFTPGFVTLRDEISFHATPVNINFVYGF